jgi:hypothetical protein
MDHPECRILKSDAVVNIEMRPEANSFDLFLKKSPVILRGLIATQAMVLNSPKYRASFQSDGVLAPVDCLGGNGRVRKTSVTLQAHDTPKEQKTGESAGPS